MFVTSVLLVCFLSLVSGNVLYFKPHQKNEAVVEFDQVPEDSPDIIVYDPVKGHKSRVPTTVESAVGERPFGSVMCPGGTSECPDDTTCCKLASGRYGCCPYPEAVCCSDMKHCCRHGFTCNLSKQRCEQGNLFMPLISKLPASKHHQKKNTRSVESSMIAGPQNICPGGEQACKNGYNCCSNANNTYSCCGYSPAHCCADNVHCCPANYKCLSNGLCEDKNGFTLPRSLKVEASSINVKANVVCPDKSQCAAGNTCCLKGVNIYGCCPLQNAVCCPDKKHCCPFRYKCGLKVGTCTMGYHTIDISMENNLDHSKELTHDFMVAAEEKVVSTDILCPDKKSRCQTGQTCCTQKSGSYGCCPVPNAVCCSDHVHCCPEGTQCSVSKGLCYRGDYSINWLEKSSLNNVSNPKGVSGQHLCPDQQSVCDPGMTCCKTTSHVRKYGCCPFRKGVCCGDHGDHCCPEGYTCDLQKKNCIKDGSKQVTEWLTTVQSTALSVQNVVCPDGKSECPTGNTCCHGDEGKYGCCPLPNAVCCPDKKHCCQENTECDSTSHKCLHSNGLLTDSFEKSESQPVVRASNSICPDGQSQCPDGNTCCALASGSYGCCPLPNAVCCADKQHCCPENYKCDSGSGKCTKNDGTSMAWLLKTESQPVAKSPDVICPDGRSQCPSGSTCCKVEGNRYGCCPQPNAVCCADLKHCCPENYKCDSGSGKCTKNDGTSMAWLLKTESQPVAKSPDVICPDGRSQCPSGSTCCKVEGNRYGCCPQPNAVCCKDEKHCCPHNTKCDTAHGMCTASDGLSIKWLDKAEALPVVILQDIICPGEKTQCPPGNTCCLTGVGQYSCCPRPNAVCCEDMKHCCPENTKCDTTSEKCIYSDGLLIDWLEKGASVPVKNLSPSFSVIVPATYGNGHVSTFVDCPGGGSCPDTNTCCKDTTGKYGCCPYAKAVCCPDGKYCCPHEYICDGNMICRDPNGIKHKDFSTNLFLQRIANRVGGKN